MFLFPPTIILRHRKENLKKCSLRGLEQRNDFLFFTYPKDTLPNLSPYLLLSIDAPPLSDQDKEKGLFLIDGTWRYAELMHRQLPLSLQARSLPSCYQTAYPRKQTGCTDPERGLASIEALFIAYMLLRRPTEGLLDGYHWKEAFLKLNNFIFT